MAVNFLFNNKAIFISKTVILELEWVLRYSYKLDRKIIFNTIQKILSTDNFHIEQHLVIEQALLWYEQGMDFADALHLSSCFNKTETFATFDKGIYQTVKRLNLKYSITLLSI